MSDHGGRLDRPLSRPVLAHTTPLLLHVSLLYSHRMHPGTSVIIPVRNGANFIREAISSVLAQLDRGDELIIVDDGSSDETLSIVLAVADPRMRVLSTTGRGVAAARNAGLAVARGEFVAFLDHDDVWPAGRHSSLLRMLDENPALDAVFGRVRLKVAAGTIPSPRYMEIDGRFLPSGFLCSGLFRRSILDRAGTFAETMFHGEDVDYYIRLVEAGMQVGLCEVDALVYRRHASNMTNDRQATTAGFFNILRRKIARTRQHSTPDT